MGGTPFPVSIARILRAVLSTGLLGSAYRSVLLAAGASSVAFWLQRVGLLRWVVFTMAQHTVACAAHRCPLDGVPGLRLPGAAVYPRFRPLRTSHGPGGYAVTPALGGRDLHPHDELSYEVQWTSRSARKPELSFDQQIARKHKRPFTPSPGRVLPNAPAGGHALPTALAAPPARRSSRAGAARKV